jgi:lysophospholipase L1-like esterase
VSENSAGTRVRREFTVGKQVLFTVIIMIGLLLVGEVGIRTWAYYFRTSYEQYNRQTGRLELVPNLHYRTKAGHEFRINSKGFVGPEFDDVPPAGTTRIMAVGDSCTFTLGLWEIAYPAVTQRLLSAKVPSGRFEYVNAGVEGYNSHYALGRIKDEIVRYKPNIVTLYVGWNDLMKQNPESQGESGEPSLLAELFNESYLVKAYKKFLFVNLRPLLVRPKVEPDEQDRHAYDHYTPQPYERNLREMIGLLRQHDIQVVLFTLPTVLERGLSAEDLKARGVFFPYYAGTYSIDRLLSLQAAYNRTIRSVAQQLSVPIVDLDEEFNKHEKKDLFWDTMHPNEKGNAIIAGLVSDTIAARLDR